MGGPLCSLAPGPWRGRPPAQRTPGHGHGQQVAQMLQGKARSVKVLDLPNLPPDGGGVSDFFDGGRIVDELVRLAGLADEWTPGPADKGQTRIKFQTAAEIAAITPEDVELISKPWVAKGSITEIDGKFKVGKTHFLMALCRAVVVGDEFLGEPTQRSPVVYLTEQPMSSLREALRRANLLEREDFHLLLYQAQLGHPGPR